LVTLSCAGFPAAELDAFFALGDAEGLFARAAGGLLYLENIGALPPIAQARLCSVVLAQLHDADPLQMLGQTPRLEPPLDAQIVVSTTRPLDGLVAEGGFRSDLYYLLGKLTLLIPSLAERVEDIPVLAKHFLAVIRPGAGLTLAPNAMLALQEARWPGNVRQLRNVLEQAAAASLTSVLSEAAIRRVIRESEEESLATFDDARRDFERDYLIRLLETTAGNVAHAARVAHRNRTEFYKLLARHGLDPVHFKQKFR
jgi:two-component system response regulator GlrR